MQYFIANITAFLCIVLLVSILPIAQQQKQRCLLFVAGIQLFVFHAFKDYTSLPDLDYYVYAYDALKHVSLANAPMLDGIKAEPGWMYMTKVLSMLSDNYLLLFVFTSALIIFSYFDVIKRYSSIVWLSIFLFLIGNYNQSIFVLRQHLAIALCLLSYPLIINRKIWTYLVVMLLAYSVHQTAIIFWPVYFLYNRNWGMWTFGIVLLCCGIYLYMHMETLLHLSLDYTKGYESYVEDDSEGSNFKMALLLVILLIWRLFVLKGKAWDVGINKLLTLILIVGCVIQVAGTGYVPTNRLNMYYSGTIFLIFPNTVAAIKNQYVRIFSIVLFSLVMFYFYLGALPHSSEAGYRFLL